MFKLPIKADQLGKEGHSCTIWIHYKPLKVLGSSCWGYGGVAGSFEHSNEPLRSIKGGEFFDQLNGRQLLKRGCVPCSYWTSRGSSLISRHSSVKRNQISLGSGSGVKAAGMWKWAPLSTVDARTTTKWGFTLHLYGKVLMQSDSFPNVDIKTNCFRVLTMQTGLAAMIRSELRVVLLILKLSNPKTSFNTNCIARTHVHTAPGVWQTSY